MSHGGARWQVRLTAAALCIAPLGIWNALSHPPASAFEQVIHRWASPIQYATAVWLVSVSGVRERLSQWTEQESEIDRLRQKLQLLREENRRLRVAGARQTRLRALEKIIDQQGTKIHAVAQVVGRRNTESEKHCTLQILDLNGLEVSAGLPVMAPEGIVGFVMAVQGRWVDVRLISDPRSSLDVVFAESREPAVLSGTPALDHTLSIGMLRAGAQVAPGDELLTSALGGRFPPDLPVARVKEVAPAQGELFRDGTAVASADLDLLEHVLILGKAAP